LETVRDRIQLVLLTNRKSHTGAVVPCLTDIDSLSQHSLRGESIFFTQELLGHDEILK